MARRPSVRYWASRGAYCCEYHGKQVILARGPDDQLHGPTYAAALKAFGELITGKRKIPTGRTYAELWERYLTHIKQQKATNTISLKTYLLTDYIKHFGEQEPHQVEPYKINDYINQKQIARPHSRTKNAVLWRQPTVTLFWRALIGMLRWALRQGLISEMPLPSHQQSHHHSKAADVILSHSEHDMIIQTEKNIHWREYWIVLSETGARPGEIANATAAHFHSTERALIFKANPPKGQYRHKMARTGKDRIIYLWGSALEIIQRRCIEHPTGTLFGGHPTHKKKVIMPGMVLKLWTNHTINLRASLVRKKTGIGQFIPYSYRHTYATRWLLNNGSVEVLAALMGNSPKTIHDHYDHLIALKKDIRTKYEMFRQVENTLAQAEREHRKKVIDAYNEHKASIYLHENTQTNTL